jgi:hypothetical protein
MKHLSAATALLGVVLIVPAAGLLEDLLGAVLGLLGDLGL